MNSVKFGLMMSSDEWDALLNNGLELRTPDISVIRFLKNIFWPRVEHVFLDRELTILEVGCGLSSLFAEPEFSHLVFHRTRHVHSIDLSQKVIEFMKTQILPLGDRQSFECVDVTRQTWLHCYELIIDSSCFHCLCEQKEQKRYLKQVRRGLVPGGLYFLQSMVMPKKLGLEDGHELDAKTGVLTREGKPWRRLIEAFEVEKMLKSAGLEIEFFKVSPNEKAVLSKERPIPMSSDPDILRVIARAPL